MGIKLQEIIPGTLTDMRKKPGDVWKLIITGRWAAISPKGWRMAYKATGKGKKNANMWAKTGKDRLGNNENELQQSDIQTYGKDNLAFA